MQFSIHRCSEELFQRQRALPVVVLLSFFLLFLQGVDQVHSHDGDLQTQYDCEICLKAGANGDAITVSKAKFQLPTARQSYLQVQLSPRSVALLSPNSRSPPLV